MGSAALSVIVAMGLMGQIGVPPLPDTPVISKVAPDECLFYMSSAGCAAPQPGSENQTEQLLAEPDVQKFGTRVEEIIGSLLDRALAEPGAPPLNREEIVSLAKTLLCRPMAVYIRDVKVEPNGGQVFGGLIVHLGESPNEFKAHLEKLVALLPPQAVASVKDGDDTWQTFKPEPTVTLTWGVKGKYFLAAVGEGEMQALVKRAFGKTPDWLAEIKKSSGVERLSMVGYLNVKSILEIAKPHAPPDAAKIFEAVGLTNVTNVTLVAGLDKTGFVSKTAFNFEGAPRGVFAFAEAAPLTAADLSAVPADAVTAFAARLDPDAIFDAYFKIVEQADPKAEADMLAAIGQMEAQFGLKLREDILQPLGDRFLSYNSANEGGPIGGTLIIRVKDAQKANATQEKLLQIAATFAQNNPRAPKIQKTEFEGREIYSLAMPGMPTAPSWCLIDKELIVGGVPDKVKAYLSRKGDFKSLADAPEIAQTLREGSGPLGVVYFDLKQSFDGLYAALPMLLAMAGPTLQQQGINFNASMLPPASSISGHLRPLVATLTKTSTGFQWSERSSLPMSVVASPANPIAIALILPAIQAAREAARRAQSMNNIKQILLAMLVHENSRTAFPPAFKADKEGKPLLGWRVLILPYLDQKELYDAFHLDEPWDSENNIKLLAKMPNIYRSPNSRVSGEGKTNYLTVRGEKTVFHGATGMKILDIPDGTSNTILVVEVNDEKAVPWTKPDDFDYDENNPMSGLGGMHPSVFLAGFADGHVESLPNTIDAATLKAFFTRNGHEVINREKDR